MEWTEKKPTQPGWYWWRNPITHEPMPVRVRQQSTAWPCECCNPDGIWDFVTTHHWDGEWAGPLSPPEEPPT